MTHDVFISYSSVDRTAADTVCSILEQNGIGCWIAPRDITPGLDFAEAIIAVGDTFTIPPLKHYGEELLRQIKAFNIPDMKHLLARFPEIVEIFSKIHMG